jgi:hypothetical protein
VQRRVKQTQQGYLGKRIGPMLGERSIGSVIAEVLNTFYAGLRRCRDHCDGQQPDPPGTPRTETAQAESAANRELLTLTLVHVGTRLRRMGTQADRDAFDALQVRRGCGADRIASSPG